MAFRQDGKVMRGMAWRAAERETFVSEHRGGLDVAVSLEQGDVEAESPTFQLSVAVFREAEGAACARREVRARVLSPPP
jgi:hypothetical protein